MISIQLLFGLILQNHQPLLDYQKQFYFKNLLQEHVEAHQFNKYHKHQNLRQVNNFRLSFIFLIFVL